MVNITHGVAKFVKLVTRTNIYIFIQKAIKIFRGNCYVIVQLFNMSIMFLRKVSIEWSKFKAEFVQNEQRRLFVC